MFRLLANFFTFVLCTHLSFSQQNLVPNPSFEDTLYGPVYTGEVWKANQWNNCGGNNTADFFYNSPSAITVGVPNNYFGNQYPATGNGYCGFYCYQGQSGNYREYIFAPLTSPMTIGQKYFVRFKVSRSDDTTEFMASSNKVGARFSVNPCSFIDSVLPDNFAHVFTTTIITDKTDWTVVSNSFIADSAYQYIRLGNFFDDANTNIIGTYYSYYYIDDICVSSDSLTCLQEMGINNYSFFDEITMFPNPFSGQTTLRTAKQLTNATLTINNCFGEIGKQIKNINGQTVVLNRDNLRSGLYYAQLTQDNQIIATIKLVIIDN